MMRLDAPDDDDNYKLWTEKNCLRAERAACSKHCLAAKHSEIREDFFFSLLFVFQTAIQHSQPARGLVFWSQNDKAILLRQNNSLHDLFALISQLIIIFQPQHQSGILKPY